MNYIVKGKHGGNSQIFNWNINLEMFNNVVKYLQENKKVYAVVENLDDIAIIEVVGVEISIDSNIRYSKNALRVYSQLELYVRLGIELWK